MLTGNPISPGSPSAPYNNIIIMQVSTLIPHIAQNLISLEVQAFLAVLDHPSVPTNRMSYCHFTTIVLYY